MIKEYEKNLLSVIVPVYNTEKYIVKCIESILEQSYSNLEIIFVNDGSKQNENEIIEQYAENDPRIKIITHEENKGLFAARITGVSHANGEYIAFVDSDDYVSRDWFRVLLERAIETGADITAGNRVETHCEEGGLPRHVYHNMDNMLVREYDLNGDDIFRSFLQQEGLCHTWHVVWNKVYKKSLWEKSLPYLIKMDQHLIMCEDVVYSFVLFSQSKKFVNVRHGWYHYCRHGDASTGLNGSTDKLKKNITDLGLSFDFIENYIREIKIPIDYYEYFTNWKNLYVRFWVDNINNWGLSGFEKRSVLDKMKKVVNCDLNPTMQDDHFFYQFNTGIILDKYYDLINKIMGTQYDIISFDIFDTLLLRPFWKPTDLFYMLNKTYRGIYPDMLLNFQAIRIDAEQIAYKRLGSDATLEDIYFIINEVYGISEENCQLLKACEIELELQYITARKSALSLFNLAKHMGKTIICISDMYLSQEVISAMLKKCGYEGIDEIFVSSEVKLSKSTGGLFKHVIEKYKKSADSFLHIGDNWDSDFLMPPTTGMHSFFFPSAKDLFCNYIGDVSAGKHYEDTYFNVSSGNNNETALNFQGLRCCLAIVVNEIFDDPWIPFHCDSDFNANPYFIGYYALGMHIFGLAKWTLEQSKGYNKIHFISRDGYLVKKAYEKLAEFSNEYAETNYLIASRKATLPLMVCEQNDIYSLQTVINVKNISPKTLLHLLADIIPAELMEKAEKICLYEKVAYNKRFESTLEYAEFSKVFIDNFYDFETIQNYRLKMKNYFDSQITAKDVTFDIGHTARTECTLCKLLNKQLDALYIFYHDEIGACRANQFSLNIKTFFDFSPNITGPVWEYVISDSNPECKAYNVKGDQVKIIYGDEKRSYQETFVLDTMQNAAIKFVNDMAVVFKENILDMFIRNHDISLPFNYLLWGAKNLDRQIFSSTIFIDKFYLGDDVRLSEFWNKQLEYFKKRNSQPVSTQPVSTQPVSTQPVSTQPVSAPSYNLGHLGNFAKFIVLFFIDIQECKKRVKTKLRKRKVLLWIIKRMYYTARGVKKIFVRRKI